MKFNLHEANLDRPMTTPEKNCLTAVKYLLKRTNARVTPEAIAESLLACPDFPSLNAVSETLEEFKIPNVSVQIPFSKIKEVPLPALAFLNSEGGIFAPVMSVGDDEIEWFHSEHGLQRENLGRFMVKWSGIVLLLQPDQFSGEVGYEKRRRDQFTKRIKTSVHAITLFIALALSLYAFTNAIPAGLVTLALELLAVKLVGALICFWLVWYEADSQNRYMKAVCKLGGVFDCDATLKSEQSKLVGLIRWSDIGLIYFLSTLMFLFTASWYGDIATAITLEGLLSIASAGMILYSLGFQLYTVKFCTYCLAVQVCLAIEILLNFNHLSLSNLILSTNTLLSGALALSLAIIFVLSFRPILQSILLIKPLQRNLKRVKFNVDFIKTTFIKTRDLPPYFPGMRVARFGDASAENLLVVVTNPTCQSCKDIFKPILETVKQSRNLQCHFILASSKASSPTLSNRVVHAILSLHEEDMLPALNSWMSLRDRSFKKWHRNLPAVAGGNGENLSLHARWLELAQVRSTPLLLLNGTEYPSLYSIEELGRVTSRLESV
jgi:hypothetical protein